jgi:hypothetical protein
MTLLIESTDVVTAVDGVPVRLWLGRTPDGVPCKVYVRLIAVAHELDSTAFDRGLVQVEPPRPEPAGLEDTP